MSHNAVFGYTQARLQARFGDYPTAQIWRQLRASGSLAHFLQNARNCAVKPWVLHVGPHSSHHQIEQSIRRQFRDHVDEVARWQPRPWRAAVRWTNQLADLPALQYLMSGQTAPTWMHDDPLLKPLSSDIPNQRMQALEESDCAPLLAAWRRGEDLGQAWYRHWRSLWPALSQAQAGALEHLAELVSREQSALIVSDHSDGLREQLERRLLRLFRQHSATPVASFAYLGLFALQLERLRAELVRRRLFHRESMLQ